MTRYVYRMDDIAPAMDWERFWRFMDLFRRHGVKPLLAVVPDNRDPGLEVDAPADGFWQILRGLVDEGSIDLAQHGYQHVYSTKAYGLLGKRYGFKPQSEFAGLQYREQLEKISAGKAILARENLASDVWVAPSHSFDRETLRALANCGFRAVSDGIGLFPARRGHLQFVPQQLWRPKAMPFGVWTICLHSNTADERLFREVEAHVRSSSEIISFSESRRLPRRAGHRWFNLGFKLLYMAHIVRHRLKTRTAGR